MKIEKDNSLVAMGMWVLSVLGGYYLSQSDNKKSNEYSDSDNEGESDDEDEDKGPPSYFDVEHQPYSILNF